MSKHDTIQRFIFSNTDVRGEIVTIRDSYQEAFVYQNCPLELKPLFGQFLSAVSLLSEVLKFDGILTLQARGNGPVPLIMAEANSNGDLRGIIRTSDTNDTLIMSDGILKALPSIVGDGVLVITIDPTKGERYQGIVPLDAPNLEECLSHYFEHSEQLPTYIKLLCDEQNSAGIFLQCLPAQLQKDPSKREDTWSTLTQLAATTSKEEIFQLEHSKLLYRLFHEHECRLFDEKTLRFACSCTFQRSANAIASMGREEAFNLLLEKQIIETGCEFCGQKYFFKEKDLLTIFGQEEKKH